MSHEGLTWGGNDPVPCLPRGSGSRSWASPCRTPSEPHVGARHDPPRREEGYARAPRRERRTHQRARRVSERGMSLGGRRTSPRASESDRLRHAPGPAAIAHGLCGSPPIVLRPSSAPGPPRPVAPQVVALIVAPERQRPRSRFGFTTFPGEIWDTPQLGRGELPERHLLQRGRQGRPLRRLGRAAALLLRTPHSVQVTALIGTGRSGAHAQCAPR